MGVLTSGERSARASADATQQRDLSCSTLLRSPVSILAVPKDPWHPADGGALGALRALAARMPGGGGQLPPDRCHAYQRGQNAGYSSTYFTVLVRPRSTVPDCPQTGRGPWACGTVQRVDPNRMQPRQPTSTGLAATP